MKLVEQHVIEKGDPRYTRIEKTAFASKNLWNLANSTTNTGSMNRRNLPKARRSSLPHTD